MVAPLAAMVGAASTQAAAPLLKTSSAAIFPLLLTLNPCMMTLSSLSRPYLSFPSHHHPMMRHGHPRRAASTLSHPPALTCPSPLPSPPHGSLLTPHSSPSPCQRTVSSLLLTLSPPARTPQPHRLSLSLPPSPQTIPNEAGGTIPLSPPPSSCQCTPPRSNNSSSSSTSSNMQV